MTSQNLKDSFFLLVCRLQKPGAALPDHCMGIGYRFGIARSPGREEDSGDVIPDIDRSHFLLFIDNQI